MPQIKFIPNCIKAPGTGLPKVPQIIFDTLTEIELVHARGLARENFPHLYRIANRMNEKNISYREAYLELRNEETL